MANAKMEIQKGLTPQDRLVLAALQDPATNIRKTISRLEATCDPSHADYLPSIVSSLDLPPTSTSTPFLLAAYTRWVQSVARHPSDAVFVTHILLYIFTLLPSAYVLWNSYTTLHALLHWMYALYCAGPFTLLMHNHLHHNGVLAKRFNSIDRIFPYVLGPLMGHTADSYKHHHKYMHHVEGNGPDDLSSTLRYQRDSFPEFLRYFASFFFKGFYKLPLYLWRHGRRKMALRAFVQEMLSVALIAWMWYRNERAAMALFVIPFVQMRFGMMLGNWGQHCLIDEEEPDSDFRSSITVIEQNSNRQCFNDGYHTSHHLNPLRHWRQHPQALLTDMPRYTSGGAIILKNIDYLELALRLFVKDYSYVADRLVPLGEQKKMSHEERMEMLRSKTRRFTDEEIEVKFRKRGRK